MKHSIRFQLFSKSARRTWVAPGLIALELLLTPTPVTRAAPLTTIVVNSPSDTWE